ncbi:MAG: hypothetical protein KF830_18890 [Planctomycetes bacterium]|nr:hypothetical protein [Planctomycetota bacterium]
MVGHDSATPPEIERGTVAVAPTSSAPVLTYEGCLIDRLRKSIKDDYPYGMSKPSVASRIERLTQDRSVNPEGKALTPEHTAALRELLQGFDRRADQEEREYWRLTRSALVAAAERGQFLVHEGQVVVADDPQEAARRVTESTEESHRMQKVMMADLESRLGVPMRDWAYSQAATTEPDGIPRLAIVYFTRAQAPEVFANGDRQTELSRQRGHAVRQFFATLP